MNTGKIVYKIKLKLIKSKFSKKWEVDKFFPFEDVKLHQ